MMLRKHDGYVHVFKPQWDTDACGASWIGGNMIMDGGVTWTTSF